MKSNSTKLSRDYLFAVLAVLLLANPASADDDRKKLKVKGESVGLFLRTDFLALEQGRLVSDVAIAGNFSITVGDKLRTGRIHFSHLLVANLHVDPEGGPPTFLSGYVSGASAMFFDDGVICTGPESGDFDETGFNLVTRARLECTDGSRMKLATRNVAVDPGVSVENEIRGKLILPKRDHD